ncbi:MAG: tetratricopeptide repeat protein, partial [Chloroflexota bacterium]|nr:tetratricopeptide repeat protein [Chloroflexota bacterium]
MPNQTQIHQTAGGHATQIGKVEGDAYITTYQHVRPQPVDKAALAAARRQLDALPLDRVPTPAPLPPCSRMPFPPNPLFVGRAPDLQTLAQTLKRGKTAAVGQIAAATGLGGIGKTQLASEFAHRYGQYFAGGVFWLSFGDPRAIPAEIAACGGAGKLDLRPNFAALPLPDQIRLVLSAWSSPLPRLLIFDNCEDQDLLAQWRPPSGGARVLVTSRRREWSATLGVRTLPLDVLPRPESIALLHAHRPDLSDQEAGAGSSTILDDLAEELGDLPLALHLAGSFLAAYRRVVTPAAYLAQLRDAALLQHASLRGRGAEHSPTGHELHVGRTFALSYERLDPGDETDAVALALLARAACFAPGEPIPRRLLFAALNLDEQDTESALGIEDGLARLAALGLLEAEAEGGLLLHRLLAAFVRQTAPTAAAQAAVEKTLLAQANRLNKAGYPAPLLAW